MVCRACRPEAGLMRLWKTSFTAGPTMKKLTNIAMGIVVASAVTYTLAKSSGLENRAAIMPLEIGEAMHTFSIVLATPRATPRRRSPMSRGARKLTSGPLT